MKKTLFYLSCGFTAFSIFALAKAEPISFHNDIRPIFENSCLECHGPEKQKADFRVDEYETLLKGGESEIPAVVPGDLVESLMVELINTDYEEEKMPPEGKADPLTDEQIALIEQWISEGAIWEEKPEPTVDFVADIQPIFEANCFKCHGPDLQESKLRLDMRASLIKGGDSGSAAIIPGKPEESELLKRIHSDDKEIRMPRDAEPLPNEDRTLIETWIAEGAIWPGQMDATLEPETTTLWSMQPLSTPEVPNLPKSNPIDAFLEAKLTEHKLATNETADPKVLIRRASIVLTGLPATPSRIAAFESEWQKNSQKAYAKLLDELFDSPHYGERWAQHWLDIIRWAETTGYESNEFRKNAWPYRDYVVDAFNNDKPYDQFVREQLAGDQLGQDVATGFLVAGPHAPASTVGQNPTDQKQARFDRLDETLQTVGSSMMAVTMNCARCHNHKFDPISIKDYYSMAAVFNDIEYDHRVPEWGKMDPRTLADRSIREKITQERAGFAKGENWTENWSDHIKIHFPSSKAKAIRFHFKPGNFSLDEIQLYTDPNSRKNLALEDGVAITSSKTEESLSRPVDFLIDDRLDNFYVWKHAKGDSKTTPWVQMDFDNAIELARAELSTNRLAGYAWQYMIDKKGKEVGATLPKSLLKIEIQNESGDWVTVATAEVENRTQQHTARVQRINELAAQHAEEGPAPIFAGKLIKPTTMHVMHRGSPTSPKAEVAPMGLEILNGDFGFDSSTPGPERRLAFAEWLTDPEHPLASRVMVNRLWHQVFGAGIVTTTGDFGFAGGTPSHPELLDWLANDFIENGWSVKTTLRKMLTTEAFTRSSTPSSEWLAIDSDSRLLWRFPPRWLEAEVLRDSILSSAGTLDLRLGGLGYHIHQPKMRYDQWKVVDNHGPQTWRRMLYQQRMRRVDDQMFTAFDFPDCAQVQSKRTRSITPLQALNLLNGDLIVEQSEKLAQRASLEAGADLNDQIDLMFQLTLGRQPDEEERSVAANLASNTGLSSVGRMLYNLNEFFYLN